MKKTEGRKSRDTVPLKRDSLNRLKCSGVVMREKICVKSA
jgi:hypothetical protein